MGTKSQVVSLTEGERRVYRIIKNLAVKGHTGYSFYAKDLYQELGDMTKNQVGWFISRLCAKGYIKMDTMDGEGDYYAGYVCELYYKKGKCYER